MRDYSGLFKELMVDSNRAFIKQIHEEQDREKQQLQACNEKCLQISAIGLCKECFDKRTKQA